MVKIVFISSHIFGHMALNGIMDSNAYVENEIEISLLLAKENKNSSNIVGYHDFSSENSLKISFFKNINDDKTKNLITDVMPDFIFVVGLSSLISSEILDIPRNKYNGSKRHSKQYGCIGMHPTLLPIGRGRAPIPWTIIKGLSKTGVTAFFLEESADSGGIICQDKIDVSIDETAESLFKKVAFAHYNLGKSISCSISQQSLSWVEQNDDLAEYWPKRTPKDSVINFNNSVIYIDRFIRALTVPYPNPFFLYKGTPVVVNRVSFRKLDFYNSNKLIGKIIELSPNNNPIIGAMDGYIEIIDYLFDGEIKEFEVGTYVN